MKVLVAASALLLGACAGERACPPSSAPSAAPVVTSIPLCPADNPVRCDAIAAALVPVDAERASFAFGVSCDGRGLGDSRRAGCVEFKTRMAVRPSFDGAALVYGPGSHFLEQKVDVPLERHGRMSFELATPDARVEASVRKTLTRHSRPFLECYASGRASDPTLSGSVELDGLVDRLGEITLIKSQARAFDHADAVDCMVRALNKYEVSPAPAAVTVLRATLTFTPPPAGT